MSTALSDEQRQMLARVADVLIPATETMPAASEVQVQGKWIDKALAARPDLLEPLLALLAAAAGAEPAEAIDTHARETPRAFEDVLLLITCAYYMSPRVRKLLGYPGQKPKPPYPDEADYYLRDGLLDPVTERGSIYAAAD